MGAGTQIVKAESPILLLALVFVAAFPFHAQAQQPASPQRLTFTLPEQDAYLDGLIRNAPSSWAHGKNWVLIQPYLLGRIVTQPVARMDCPNTGLAYPWNDATNIPAWIYSATELCNELATTHDAAVVVLEDPMDMDAAYFLFLECEDKRHQNKCDMEGYSQQNGMKLQESNKGGHRQFNATASTAASRNARFLVAEVWHMRNPEAEPSDKQ